jgi:PAS domain S-box-containing protein
MLDSKHAEGYFDDDKQVFSLSSLPVPSVLCRNHAKTDYCANQAFVKMLGEDQDWDPSWWIDSLDPESREIIIPILSRESSAGADKPIRFRKRDGSWVDVTLFVSETAEGLLLLFGPPGNSTVQTIEPSAPEQRDACDFADALPIGIIRMKSSRSGEISFCNKFMEQVLGINRDECVGRNYLSVFSSENLGIIRRLVTRACEDGSAQRLDHVTIAGFSGVRRVLNVKIDVLRNESEDDKALILVAIDVTDTFREQEEKARISEALMCREENYRLLTDNSSDLITRHGFEGIILFASNAAKTMLGLDPASMMGHSLEEYVHVDDRPYLRDFILNLNTKSGASTITFRMMDCEGKPIWVETRATAVRGKRGGLEITCVSRDVSERKLVEDRLRILQNQFSDAIENMDAGIVMYDKNDRMVFCNKVYKNYFPNVAPMLVPGITHQEVLQSFISQGVANKSGLTEEGFMAMRRSDHCARKGTGHIVCVSGNRWLQVSDHPTHEGGVVSLMTDISALKHTQDELSHQKLLLSSLIDAIPDLLSYKDESGTYVVCNQAFCDFVGMPMEKVIGKHSRDVFDDARNMLVATFEAQALKEKGTSRNEEWVVYPDGRRVRFESNRTPIYSPDGRLLGIVCISRDITSRHVAETMLRAESMRLTTLIRSLEGGILVVDQNMRVLLVNEGFLSLMHFSGKPSDIVGADCHGMMQHATEGAESRLDTCEQMRKIFTQKVLIRSGIIELRKQSFAEYDFIPIEIEPGQFNFIWHFRDITQRRKTEMELQQRNVLLSGLAQTVRQLLAGLEDFDASITEAFRIIAETANIERIIIFQNVYPEDSETEPLASYKYRWSRTLGAAKEIPEYARMPYFPDFTRWFTELSRGVILSGPLKDFPDKERHFLEKHGFGSVLVAPMFIEETFWGFMMFDATPNREWNSSDRGILRMMADSIGLAIQRKRANDQLNSALAQAEKLAIEARTANQAKTDFLASMSHEIRTPLNGVVGYGNLLRNTQLTSRQAELLRGIDRSSEILLSLINDILDLSKISAGQLTLDFIPFCPAQAAEDAIAALNPKASEKGLNISCDADFGARQVFIGDERRLKQVLLNLIGNAIKFTEKGSVDVFVRTAETVVNGQPTRLDFKVVDSGIGISEENQAKLFRPFSQAHTDISRRYGGTGLGLAICKQLVEKMEGHIWLESTPGKGSVFAFYIICKAADEPIEETHSSVSEELEKQAKTLPLKILIADDNLINQEVMSLYIEEMGYKPEVVESGRAALNAVKDHPIDLILMDLRMPDMDGIEATQAIREWERTNKAAGRPRTRIVALTADAVKSDSERCMQMGMDGYLTKPIDPDQILRVIKQLFS